MNTLTTETRREKIKEMLQKTDHPVTASSLAEHFSVSRQIIVGDIALLRASGLQILATPRGYLMDSPSVQEDKNLGMIACRHTPEQLRDELYTIVDGGATVVDVTIEHTLYGELSGKLDLASRYDVDAFIRKVEEEKNSIPLSALTDGVHLHRGNEHLEIHLLRGVGIGIKALEVPGAGGERQTGGRQRKESLFDIVSFHSRLSFRIGVLH